MTDPPPGKGLAIASLCLGFVGLVTAGGCGLGSLVGLALGLTALFRSDRLASLRSGRDVAWAGIVTNTLALLTLAPVAALLLTLDRAGALPRPGAEEELPEPVRPRTFQELEPPPPPPAPPSGSPAPRRLGGSIPEPTKLRHVDPVYPPLARQARVQGTVVLEANIDPNGKITDVRVLSGHSLLREAAKEAVRQWEYTPTLLEGAPVPVIVTVTVRFRLD